MNWFHQKPLRRFASWRKIDSQKSHILNQIGRVQLEEQENKDKEKGNLPLFEPTEKLSLGVLAPLAFFLFFRMQKARASNTARPTNTEPRIIPAKAPTVNPPSE